VLQDIPLFSKLAHLTSKAIPGAEQTGTLIHSMEEQGKSENDLVKRLIRGDKKSFEDIYCAYYDRLFNFAREYIGSRDDTADLIQNVFTKLWANRKRLESDSNIGAWLFTVTRNEAISYLEHRRIVLAHRDNEQTRINRANMLALKQIRLSDDTLFNIYDIIGRSIDNMPPQCRKVFLMSRVRRMTYEHIARKLSISVKTVESHMSAALAILRKSLSDYLVIALLISLAI
jgi:RNA polymerase sigma-70 factor (ECF subfamily)